MSSLVCQSERTVSEILKSGWTQTAPKPIPPGTYTVSIATSGQVVIGKDFGNFQTVTVTADKFNDLNGNGVRDGSEPAIVGWQLTLHCPNGTTNTKGSPAVWTVINGGDYYVTEELQAGWVHTTLGSVAVTVQSGDAPATVWFGNFKVVTITADKWNDLDGDGVRDVGEPEIPGWHLTITCPNGTTSSVDSPASWTVMQSGTYTITEELQAGWVHTTLGSVDVAVQSGDTADTVWFGNFKLATITADKWNDLNDNAAKDVGEPEISGWQLTITCPNGTTSTLASPASWTVVNGGKCTISEELKSGWQHTTSSSVEIDVQSGSTPDTVWFGNFQIPPAHCAIGDFVWNDLDRDGIQDAGEPSLPGVVVNLYDSLGNPVTTATTDGNGLYSFIVDQGSYYLEFVPPSGYTLTPKDQGANDAKDSDPDPTTHTTITFTVTSGQADNTWDAGMYSIAQPVGGVWFPADKVRALTPWIGYFCGTMAILALFVFIKRKKK